MPVTADFPVMRPEDARKHIDENTIGIVVMFGSTYNGQFEDVEATNTMIGEFFDHPLSKAGNCEISCLHFASILLLFTRKCHT